VIPLAPLPLLPGGKALGRRKPRDALAARELERAARRGRGRFAVGASEGDADQTVDELEFVIRTVTGD
jgi:hypothetical protein